MEKNSVIALSIGRVVDEHLKGGMIQISSVDAEYQKRLETNYEFALTVFLQISAAGIAECIRSMIARNMGTEEQLVKAFGKTLAENFLAADTGLPGGLLG